MSKRQAKTVDDSARLAAREEVVEAYLSDIYDILMDAYDKIELKVQDTIDAVAACDTLEDDDESENDSV